MLGAPAGLAIGTREGAPRTARVAASSTPPVAGMIRHAVVTADWRIRPEPNDTLARLKQVVADN
jgi:hypothetical protein